MNNIGMNIYIEKKTVLCTILYKPDASVVRRIKNAAESGCQIYVLDNTPGSYSPAPCLIHQSIRVFSFGKNIGIGPALRLMCATALYEGFLQLLYFDQDTVFTAKTLEYVGKFASYWLERKNEKLEKYASITFRDFSPEGKRSRIKDVTEEEFTVFSADFTISSGSLFDLWRLKAAGWHRDDFFIDGVDYAVCCSIARAGYSVGEIGPVPELDHASEQADEGFCFFGYSFRGRRYPFYRCMDNIFSSLRLIGMASRFSSRRGLWLVRNLLIFIVYQVLARISSRTTSS